MRRVDGVDRRVEEGSPTRSRSSAEGGTMVNAIPARSPAGCLRPPGPLASAFWRRTRRYKSRARRAQRYAEAVADAHRDPRPPSSFASCLMTAPVTASGRARLVVGIGAGRAPARSSVASVGPVSAQVTAPAPALRSTALASARGSASASARASAKGGDASRFRRRRSSCRGGGRRRRNGGEETISASSEPSLTAALTRLATWSDRDQVVVVLVRLAQRHRHLRRDRHLPTSSSARLSLKVDDGMMASSALL